MTRLSALSAPLSAPCCARPPNTPRGAHSRCALLRGIGGQPDHRAGSDAGIAMED
jgi:hypothetical protein